ncbi:site-specific DNA-methyltransferase [Devosia sp.]|uniref:DNA-methyltransferase n=1 Tax=Devosia sp. TaxID=1871048 RepID=UPI003265856D
MNEHQKKLVEAGELVVALPFLEGRDQWRGSVLSGPEWALYNGSALEVLRQLPANSISCVVTSPPYFWLRDYGVEGQIGLEGSVEEYVANLAEVMLEVQRVLRPDGLLFLNIGDTFYSGKGESQGTDRKSSKRRFGLRAVDRSGGMGIGLQRKSLIGVPWRVAMRLAEQKWVLRSSVIWHRKHALPEPVRDRAGRSYEYVFMLAKSRKYYFDKTPLIEKKIDEDMWSIAAKPKARTGIETAPFPDELVERCLSIGCRPGGVVLDPFSGSGTTVRVAVKMGHSAIGIELNREFCLYTANEMAINR